MDLLLANSRDGKIASSGRFALQAPALEGVRLF
jgi:hypothetical protein